MKAVMKTDRLKEDMASLVIMGWKKPSRMPTAPNEKLPMVKRITTKTIIVFQFCICLPPSL